MLALIAGQGALPGLIVQAQPVRPLVWAVEGCTPDGVYADGVLRIGQLGTVLQDMKTRGVTQVCLAGAVNRPVLDAGNVDAATMPLVQRLKQALTLGDDGALRIVLDILQEAGFQIVAAHDLLAPLLPQAGVLTRKQPGPDHRIAAQLGQRTIAAMGVSDTGQACVVAGTEVVAREDAAGTDAMLARLSRDKAASGGWDPFGMTADLLGGVIDSASDWLSNSGRGAGGAILFKAPKPGQDRRADLPVIGPITADHVVSAGLDGIVIEEGGVMVIDRKEVVRCLDAAGLFLWVRSV